MLKEILKKLSLLTFLVFFVACQNRIVIDDITTIPPITETDKPFADVYKLLDGTWEGTFEIYEDTQRQKADQIELKKLSKASLDKEGLQLSNAIRVTQVYESRSPYFQTVQITDRYPESGKTEQSKGVNKIQDGKMWCVVRKPGDTVIHEGQTEGSNTIIWQSDTATKKEYFYETVNAQTYEIIGWGYYGADEDRTLSPKLWFYGSYERK